MQAKEGVSLLLAICFLYLSQSSYIDQSKDKQEDSPEWVTHAGFVTLILTASFCPMSPVCSLSAGVPVTRHSRYGVWRYQICFWMFYRDLGIEAEIDDTVASASLKNMRTGAN
jgi:hypothetical protein